MELQVPKVSKVIAIPGKIIGWLNKKIFNAFGWRFEGEVPKEPKWLGLGVYHTSNWDLPIMLAAAVHYRIKAHWIGKHTLFKPPFGRLMQWMGGIAIRRDKSYNAVQQVVDEINKHEKLVLVIAPEGTRKFVDHWKTGFYYMALGAKIPLVLCYINYERKVIGLGEVFYPTGDIEADYAHIREYYEIHARGRFPEKQGLIRLKPKATELNE